MREKRTAANAREYWNANGHSMRLQKRNEGVTVKLWLRDDICAVPTFELFASFEDAIARYTKLYGAWKRVEYRAFGVGW